MKLIEAIAILAAAGVAATIQARVSDAGAVVATMTQSDTTAIVSRPSAAH